MNAIPPVHMNASYSISSSCCCSGSKGVLGPKSSAVDMLGGSGGGGDPGSGDLPPLGCDSDAVKLFVGNIPLQYSEDQLLPLFQVWCKRPLIAWRSWQQ